MMRWGCRDATWRTRCQVLLLLLCVCLWEVTIGEHASEPALDALVRAADAVKGLEDPVTFTLETAQEEAARLLGLYEPEEFFVPEQTKGSGFASASEEASRVYRVSARDADGAAAGEVQPTEGERNVGGEFSVPNGEEDLQDTKIERIKIQLHRKQEIQVVEEAGLFSSIEGVPQEQRATTTTVAVMSDTSDFTPERALDGPVVHNEGSRTCTGVDACESVDGFARTLERAMPVGNLKVRGVIFENKRTDVAFKEEKEESGPPDRMQEHVVHDGDIELERTESEQQSRMIFHQQRTEEPSRNERLTVGKQEIVQVTSIRSLATAVEQIVAAYRNGYRPQIPVALKRCGAAIQKVAAEALSTILDPIGETLATTGYYLALGKSEVCAFLDGVYETLGGVGVAAHEKLAVWRGQAESILREMSTWCAEVWSAYEEVRILCRNTLGLALLLLGGALSFSVYRIVAAIPALLFTSFLTFDEVTRAQLKIFSVVLVLVVVYHARLLAWFWILMIAALGYYYWSGHVVVSVKFK